MNKRLACYNPASENPAVLLVPSDSIETDCEEGEEEVAMLNFGVFTDWTAAVGAETFVLPSEMECLAWDVDGVMLATWPTDRYEGALYGSSISPTSLGNLNNSLFPDVLFSSAGILYAFDLEGEPLDANLDFLYVLPDFTFSSGGFAIADIDRDGEVEIVFGTTDGYLQC